MIDIPENQTPEEQAKEDKKPPLKSETWLSEVRAAEKALNKFWEQGDKIVKRFLDKRESGNEDSNKLNLFTVNTEILKGTLYATFPKPMIDREFNDQDDDVARVASEMLERVIKVKKRDDFDSAMREVVQDWLLPGIGQLWFRYEPTITKETLPPIPDPTTGGMAEPISYDKVINEEVLTDYVYWKDFIWSPCRTWAQCRWVGRRLKLSKSDASARFGAVVAEKLSYNLGAMGEKAQKGEKEDLVKYAEIFEIWCKRSRKVYWVSEGFEFCLDVKDDPLELLNFFPCPKPLLALHATDSLIPRADYLMVQDQYVELDDLNNRITVLERAVKVVGVYDGANEEIKRIFTEAIENRIIPMTSFSQFAEKGGFKGAIDWIPIEATVKAIDALRAYRQELIAQIYELTGISDIMRGATKASETLGAQELKAQYGAVRTQDRQLTISTFVEEGLEIKAEIIRHKFQPQTILARSNIENTPDAEYAQAALELLQNPMVEYRIEVHPDTMAIPEFNAERDARLQYIRAISEYLTAAVPLIQQDPSAGVYLLEIMKWAAAGFRVGRSIEGVLDKAIKAMQKKLSQPAPPPPPPPEIEKAKIDAASAEKLAQIKADTEKLLNDIKLASQREIEELKLESSEAIARLKIESDKEIELFKIEQEGSLQSQKIDADREQSAKPAVSIDPGPAVEKLVQPIVDAQEDMLEAIENLANTLTKPIVDAQGGMLERIENLANTLAKPRVRTPVKDKNGDIISVTETIGE